MNLRRLVLFASPLLLLGLGAAPAHAEAVRASASLAAFVPAPLSGLLFFLGVGIVAGALEVRRRASTR